MSKTALPKWTPERTDTLVSIVGTTTPVTQETVKEAADSLETTARSVASKLRKMEYVVESSAQAKGKTYSEEEEAEIVNFLNAKPNQFTYAEIASQILGGSRTAKQIQGKILSMDLTGLVKPTEKVERAKAFTDEEEKTLLGLLTQKPDLFIEDIADVMNREIKSIRGKILSMSRVYPDITIPKQRVYKSKKADAFTELGDVSEMTVEDIAEAIDKSERGVKTILSHRGVDCSDYKGAKRRAKLDEDKVSEATAA